MNYRKFENHMVKRRFDWSEGFDYLVERGLTTRRGRKEVRLHDVVGRSMRENRARGAHQDRERGQRRSVDGERRWGSSRSKAKKDGDEGVSRD